MSAPEISSTVLRAKGLSKSFRMGESQVHVLRGVNLDVKQGEFIAIEGRSGSGKSTLLHALSALESVDNGALEFNGRDYALRHPGESHPWLNKISGVKVLLAGLGVVLLGIICFFFSRLYAQWLADKKITWFSEQTSQWVVYVGLGIIVLAIVKMLVFMVIRWIDDAPNAKLRNRDFGFVFQFYHLLPELSVLQNALLSSMIQKSAPGFLANRSALHAKATEVLTLMGLGNRLTHRPAQLSGGERQRVAIARALMNDPKILFADEPTGNLDYETGRQIMGILEKLHREKNQTIIMVTHDRALARQADRVLVLKDGKLQEAEMAQS